MYCEEYEDALIDLAFGAPAAPGLETHLARCAGCRARLSEERGLAAVVDGHLASALDVAPSTAFEDGVRRRIGAPRRSRIAVPAAWIGAAVAATLFIALRIRVDEPPAPTIAETRPLAPAVVPPPTVMPRVVETPAPPVRHASMRRARKAPAEPEVLVPPDQQRALSRWIARLAEPAGTNAALAREPARPFQPVALEVGTIDDLPRLSVSEARAVEPVTPLNRLASGGDL